jgi:hypothetical protein
MLLWRQKTDRLLNDMNKRRVVDRLVRVERSLLRLEQSNSLILRTLQKLIEKIRPSSDKNTVKQ